MKSAIYLASIPSVKTRTAPIYIRGNSFLNPCMVQKNFAVGDFNLEKRLCFYGDPIIWSNLICLNNAKIGSESLNQIWRCKRLKRKGNVRHKLIRRHAGDKKIGDKCGWFFACAALIFLELQKHIYLIKEWVLQICNLIKHT